MGLDSYLKNNEDEILVGMRKANQIHSWFVENVQNGVDDQGTYEVNLEQLRILLDLCKKVRDNSKLKKTKIEITDFDDKDKLIRKTIDWGVIKDPSFAKKYLPTREGFFFGNTDYDKGYLDDIKNLIPMLEEIINDLEKNDNSQKRIFYESTW